MGVSRPQVGNFCMFAHVFNLHHVLDQTVHTKHRRETLELVQDAVGTIHIAFVDQVLQLWQVIAQCLMQGFEQRQDALGVPNEFHGPVNGQKNGLWPDAHGALLRKVVEGALVGPKNRATF